MALTHVIAYDISDDHRRARIAAVLQAYGDRIQRSVFICALEADLLAEVRADRRYHQPGDQLGLRLPPMRGMLGRGQHPRPGNRRQRTAVLDSAVRGGW